MTKNCDCDQSDSIYWIKHVLSEINRKVDLQGMALITIQNQTNEIAINTEKLKWLRRSNAALWAFVVSVTGAAITGVILYLLKYPHV